MSRTSIRSQAHTESHPWATTCERTRSRVGSDRALSFVAMRSASAVPNGVAFIAQHSAAAPRCDSPLCTGLSTDVLITPAYIDGHRCVRLACRIDIHRYKGGVPMSTTATTAAQKATPVAKEMSFLDRWLPVWILAAMAVGLLLGRFVPGLDTALDAVKIGGISVPIALGLLVMMYPVLAKVRYDEMDRVTGDRK